MITGVNGFVGHHLVDVLKADGHTVIGIGQDAEATAKNADKLARYISCDLTDEAQVRERVSYDGVDGLIHLAGLANVGMSFAQPALFLAANAAMSTNLLQAALDEGAKTRFVIISTGAVYDNDQQLPISESGELTHKTPYAVSKLSVEMMNDYYRSRGIEIATMRPFNHFGPGQMQGFIVPDLLAKLQAYQESGSDVGVGNLKTARDYTDVRDVASAYAAVACADQPPKHSVYNVCSGKSRTGTEIYAALAAALNITPAPEPKVDQSLIRPNETMNIYGDASRLTEEFGWKPQHSFEQTIQDTVKASTKA